MINYHLKQNVYSLSQIMFHRACEREYTLCFERRFILIRIYIFQTVKTTNSSNSPCRISILVEALKGQWQCVIHKIYDIHLISFTAWIMIYCKNIKVIP
jgi:hypothetical protein